MSVSMNARALEGKAAMGSNAPTGADKEVAPHELQAAGPHRLLVCVRSIERQADGINAYEVIDPRGSELPAFSAGSHIDLFFRDGRVRQYSLCSDPAQRHHYVFAVQREPAGRGGSQAIFERIHVGRILAISEPRNHFPLAEDANYHLMVAGGIGVTPMIAMIFALEARGANYTLHYCTRAPEKTAFLDVLAPRAAKGKVILHHDGGDPRRGLQLEPLLRSYQRGTHLYYCGPHPLMNAVKRACAHWPAGTTHREYFAQPEMTGIELASSEIEGHLMSSETQGESNPPATFQIKVASTGAVFEVPEGKTITDVLREHGISVPTSCESGLCGTCRTRYLEGIPDHRDYVLQDEEKDEYVLICCARAKTPMLVLDL